MKILVGRHALSEGNNRDNNGTLLFGHPAAPLMELGRGQSQEMGRAFLDTYGVKPATTPIAVSNMLRSQETARYAGFNHLVQYEQLDEVDTELDYSILKQWINEKRHTDIALKAARLILENPPKESVWITHGLVISAMCEILDVTYKFDNFLPKFCEIRELQI